MKYRLQYKLFWCSGEYEDSRSGSSNQKRVFSANTNEKAREKARGIIEEEERNGSSVPESFTTLVRIEQEEITRKVSFDLSSETKEAKKVCRQP